MKLKRMLVLFSVLLLLALCLGGCMMKDKDDTDGEALNIFTSDSTYFVGAYYSLSPRYTGSALSSHEFALTENTADAFMVYRDTVCAKKAGSVSVTLTGHPLDGDESLTAYLSMTFHEVKPELINHSGRITVGSPLTLNGTIVPVNSELVSEFNSADYQGDRVSYTFEVVSGNATITTTDGVSTLLATEAGDVSLKITYTDSKAGLTLTNTKTVTVSESDLKLSTDATAFHVREPITLSVSSESITDLVADNVVYTVESGDATLEGATLTANSEGEVKVSASYTKDGITVKSNVLTLSFTYGGNSIQKAEDLLLLTDSAEVFNLVADIDLSTYEDWTPISGFSGTLYGNGHKITGLKVTAANLETHQGLFSVLKGTVDNLSLTGALTSTGGASYLGLLCGENAGTVQNVTVSGSVTAKFCDYVGGIAGVSNSNITGCTSSAAVEAKSFVGGVVGRINAQRSASSPIKELTNNGSVIGVDYVGGITGFIGLADGKNNDTVLVQKLVNNGTVSTTGNYVGGIVGQAMGKYSYINYDPYSAYLSFTECSNTASINGVDYVGGLVGDVHSYVSEFTLCTATGDVTGNTHVGGYAGEADPATLIGLTYANTVTGKAYVGGIAGTAAKLDSCVNNGQVINVGFDIYDNIRHSYVGGIAGLATNIINCENNSDLDVSTGGRFVGGIVGYLNASRSSSYPVSGNVNRGSVKGTEYVGGIAGSMVLQDGKNNDTVTVANNINSKEIIGSGSYVGGLFGFVSGKYSYINYDPYYSKVSISGCSNEADVSGVDYVGGIVGHAPDYISDMTLCTSIGDITGNLYVGGFGGYLDRTSRMMGLINNNTITGKAYVGGIAGRAGYVESCENNGTLTITGFHLDGSTPLSYVGGIAGIAFNLVGCTNNADIEADVGGQYVGGIAGYLHAERSGGMPNKNNKNNGSVKGTNYVGGIAGIVGVRSDKNNDTIEISNNSNSGNVEASGSYVGGLFGYASGNHSYINYDNYNSSLYIRDNKNEGDVTGFAPVGGIVGEIGGLVDTNEVVWSTNVSTSAPTVLVPEEETGS